MVTYYNKQEFVNVVSAKIFQNVIEQKADIANELSVIYFDKSPDVEYGIRGVAFLKTSYNDSGYFIKKQKDNP